MPAPVHRDQARKFLAGVITLLVIGTVAFVGSTVQAGGELPGKGYTYVTAAFQNVGMLNPRQDVTQNGVRVGTVSSITYRDGVAVVTMRLDGQRDVYRDATASVHNASALGRKHVELNPGTAAAGPLGGQAIPLQRTDDSTALDDVLDTLDPQTRAGLGASLRELGGGTAGHSSDLHDFVQTAGPSLESVGRIAGTLTSPGAEVPQLLDSASRLAGRFQGHEADLAALLSQADSTFRAVSVDGGQPLGTTLRDLPPTLQAARQGLDALRGPLADARSAMSTLRPGADALGASTGDLRGLLREAVGPLRQVPGVSGKATPAVQDLTQTFADARPLVPQVSDAINAADVLLAGLAPYATDIGRFFSEHDLLSGSIAPDQHYFSAMLVLPGLYSASLPDPTVNRIPYPQPGGGAWRDNPAEGGNR